MPRHQLDTPKGLADFDKYLTDYSYADGYSPSQEDVSVFKTASSAPDKKFPHVARWYRHIESFSAEERSAFPGTQEEAAPAAKAAAAPAAKPAPADDDDIDLFGEETEEDRIAREAHEEEIERRAQEQLAKKKASGKQIIAKSMVLFDVKPLDDETDMAEIEKYVRALVFDGLEWKASKLVPVAYGIKKLQIQAVVVDDLVSIDDVVEKIQENEDLVQSVDIASFNKL